MTLKMTAGARALGVTAARRLTTMGPSTLVFSKKNPTQNASRPAMTVCATTAALTEAERIAATDSRRVLCAGLQPPSGSRADDAHDRRGRTGCGGPESCPGFDAMPSIPSCPILVLREDGRIVPVTTPAIWTRQKRPARR